MKRFAIVAFGLMVSVFVLGSVTRAATTETVHLSKKQVKELVANAKTPQDHLKLAAYFNQEAAKLEDEAQQHEELAEIYKSHPAVLGSKSSVPAVGNASHCLNIAKSDREAAREYTEMAASHASMAKAAEK